MQTLKNKYVDSFEKYPLTHFVITFMVSMAASIFLNKLIVKAFIRLYTK